MSFRSFALAFSAVTLAAGSLTAASVPPSKPEEIGLSTERLQRIHETVQRHIDAHDISGAVTVVARKGKLAHLEAHGLMDIDSNKAMSKDTMFWIASMSKPITGTAILMLMEEGKLRLTDPVSKFIPEFKGLKVAVMEDRPGGRGAAAPGTAPLFYTVPATREITIQDLLSHVSGLISGGPASAAEAAKVARKPGEKLSDVIPRYASTPLDFQPGARWSYSPSAGFETLGRIVEIASGQTFDVFLKQRIFEPLGMKDITFHPSQAQMPRVATMYHRQDGTLKKADTSARINNTTYFSGAGGLMSDAEDYVQFGQMLANGGQLNGKRLLGTKTVELMSSIFAPDTLPGRPKGRSFGLSVQVINDPIAANTRISTGSYGWDGAFGTHFWVDPKEKMVGIIMIQTDNPNRELNGDFENAVMQAVVE